MVTREQQIARKVTLVVVVCATLGFGIWYGKGLLQDKAIQTALDQGNNAEARKLIKQKLLEKIDTEIQKEVRLTPGQAIAIDLANLFGPLIGASGIRDEEERERAAFQAAAEFLIAEFEKDFEVGILEHPTAIGSLADKTQYLFVAYLGGEELFRFRVDQEGKVDPHQVKVNNHHPVYAKIRVIAEAAARQDR